MTGRSTTSQPVVSVVTPFYNTERYLGECIESVLAQTFDDFEYVLVNNCSTDGSVAIAERYAERDRRIRIVGNGHHLEQVENYNEALRHIVPDSRYVKIVQADDWLFPNCLHRMVEVARTHETVGIVGAYMLLQDCVYLDELPYPSTFQSGRDAARAFILEGRYFFGSPTATLLRADLVRARDPFYDEQSPVEDVDVCFELLQHSDFGFVHQVLTFTRREDESTISAVRAFQPMMMAEMIAVQKYGPHFLDAEELRRRRKEVGWRYYKTLGERVLRRPPEGFWEFHRRGLTVAGTRMHRGRLLVGLIAAVLDLVLNPLSTVVRIWNYRRRSTKRS